MYNDTFIKDIRACSSSVGTRYRVFFDFDNTITSFDVLDAIIAKFSPNESWRIVERAWQEGTIGSRECLDKQVRGLCVSKRTLTQYLSAIRIDPAFVPLLSLCSAYYTKPLIVSDSFSFIIRTILATHKVFALPVYANRLRFKGNKLIPIFPYTNKACVTLCAHCKKNTLLDRVKSDTITIYIGDGLSDVCASLEADIVFAKTHLARQLDRQGKRYIPFTNLESVYTCLSEVFCDWTSKNEQEAKKYPGR